MPLGIDINGGTLPEVEATADRIKKQSNLGDQFKTTNPPTPTINISSNFNSNEDDSRDGIKGFYYDYQLNNRLTSVTLHANTIFKNGEWKLAEEDLDSENYMKTPLCRSILSEDYQVAVSNTWSEFGDDALGAAFNSLKPFAPYLEHLGNMLYEAGDKEKELAERNDSSLKSSYAKFMIKTRESLKDISSEGSKLLNRSLVAQGARFSYYSGTGTGFGNLSMKFTIFADWVLNDKGKYDFKTVDDQLSLLYPYVIGKYEKGVVDSNGNIKGTNISTGLNEESTKLLNEYLGWQMPPAGYKPSTKNVDNVQFGTLKLKFGAFYSLSSLVCTNSQFQFSKQMVKNWNGTGNKLTPLYCDVMLTFQPATKYSDDSLRRFISGNSMKEEIKDVQDSMRNTLNKRIRDNNNLLNNN